MAALATDTALGWYVYGVVPSSGSTPSSWPTAVDPRYGIELLEYGPLAALVSRVPVSEYEEAPLQQRLEDLDWLEQAIRAHESVVEQALTTVTVVPFRFCTIYRSDDQVRELLAERGPAFAEALEWLAGRSEWGVKVLLDRERCVQCARCTRQSDGNTEYL